MSASINLPTVTNDGLGASVFSERAISLHGENARKLSERQNAENFRFRTSDHSYRSDWHVAGDPTLIIVMTGELRICLRNGEQRDFRAGEAFIAEDYLNNIEFDHALHGHRAEVIGDDMFTAIHLKLAKRP